MSPNVKFLLSYFGAMAILFIGLYFIAVLPTPTEILLAFTATLTLELAFIFKVISPQIKKIRCPLNE